MHSKPDEIRATVARGMQLRAARRYAEAESAYSEAIGKEPRYFDALHLLGVLKIDQGNYLAGAQLIQNAIDINPNFAKAHLNLGLALAKLGATEEAVASYDRA